MEKIKATDRIFTSSALSVRFRNVCKQNGIETFGDLVAIPIHEVQLLPNFGKRAFNEYLNIIDRIECEEPKPEQQPQQDTPKDYIITITPKDGKCYGAYDIRKVSYLTKFEATEIHIIIDGVLLRWGYANEEDRNNNFDQILEFLKATHIDK